MGLRFRKSISLGSFLRLNLSKSGVSVGVGPRGLNVNIGPRGMRKTVGLPGTGLYYQETSSWPKSTEASSSTNASTDSSSSGGWLVLGLVIVIIVVAVNLGGRSTSPGSTSTVTNTPKAEAQPSIITPLKPDRVLNREEIRELQALLRKQGFDAGMPDGILGPKTQAAAQAYIRTHRLDVQGPSSLRLLEAARGSRKQAR